MPVLCFINIITPNYWQTLLRCTNKNWCSHMFDHNNVMLFFTDVHCDGDPYAFPPLTPKSSASASPTTPTLGPRLTGGPRGLGSEPFTPSPGAPHGSLPTSIGLPHSVPTMGPDLFKQPMLQQPVSSKPHDPFAQPPSTPRPDVFSPAQSIGIHPTGDPYAIPPGTPRPVMDEHFKKSPGHPGMEGGFVCRPGGPTRFPTPPGRGPEQFTANPGSRIHTPRGPSPQGMNMDPYSQPPSTPRPAGPQDPFAVPPGTPRPAGHPDPYAVPPGTPRPAGHPDPYAVPPSTPRPTGPQDPFAVPPSTPRPTGPQDPFAVPPSTPRPTGPQDPFAVPPSTPRPAGPQDTYAMPLSIQRPPTTPTDPYAQPPGTPMPPSTTHEFHPDLPPIMAGGRPRFPHDLHNTPHTMVGYYTLTNLSNSFFTLTA